MKIKDFISFKTISALNCFVLMFFLVNCQKEDINDRINIDTTTKNASFEVISKKRFVKNKTLSKVIDNMVNQDSRIIYSDSGNFAIDDEYTLLSTINNYKTYTFKVLTTLNP